MWNLSQVKPKTIYQYYKANYDGVLEKTNKEEEEEEVEGRESWSILKKWLLKYLSSLKKKKLHRGRLSAEFYHSINIHLT